MRYVLVTPPAEDLISRDDAKAQLRVGHDDEDDLIDDLIAEVSAHLEGRVGILGRALVSTTYRLEVWRPYCDQIRINMPDVQSISGINYLVSGTPTAWSSSEYRLGYHRSSAAFVEPAEGYGWPSADDREDAFQITFVAGYGDATAVPKPIIRAAKLLIGAWYENREAVGEGGWSSLPRPAAVDSLLRPFSMGMIG